MVCQPLQGYLQHDLARPRRPAQPFFRLLQTFQKTTHPKRNVSQPRPKCRQRRGYPRRLKGDEISLQGRLIALAGRTVMQLPTADNVNDDFLGGGSGGTLSPYSVNFPDTYIRNDYQVFDPTTQTTVVLGGSFGPPPFPTIRTDVWRSNRTRKNWKKRSNSMMGGCFYCARSGQKTNRRCELVLPS